MFGGGVHASAIYDLCLKESYIDFVICGEGEISLFELLKAIEGKIPFNTVRNLCYKNNNELKKNSIIFESNIDKFKIDFTLLNNYEKYIENYRGQRLFNSYITSRGCPFNCSFCYNNMFNKRRWRAHSIQRVINDILQLKRIVDFDRITLVDDQFFANEKRARIIIEELFNIGVSIHNPDMRIENITEENLKLLMKTGCKEIFVGTESDSNRVLKFIKKQTTKEKIIEKFSIISKFPQIKVFTNFIFGLPSHTLEEIYNSLDFIYYHTKKIKNLKIGVTTYLPLPGTELYDIICKSNVEKPSNILFWSGFSLSKKGQFEKYKNFDWLNFSKKDIILLNKIYFFMTYYNSVIPTTDSSLTYKVFSLPFFISASLRLKYKFFYYSNFEAKLFFFLFKLLKKIKYFIKKL